MVNVHEVHAEVARPDLVHQRANVRRYARPPRLRVEVVQAEVQWSEVDGAGAAAHESDQRLEVVKAGVEGVRVVGEPLPNRRRVRGGRRGARRGEE